MHDRDWREVDSPTDAWSVCWTTIAEFRAELPPGRTPRIALGRVILPTDSVDAPTRRKYEAYVASRYERTLAHETSLANG